MYADLIKSELPHGKRGVWGFWVATVFRFAEGDDTCVMVRVDGRSAKDIQSCLTTALRHHKHLGIRPVIRNGTCYLVKLRGFFRPKIG